MHTRICMESVGNDAQPCMEDLELSKMPHFFRRSASTDDASFQFETNTESL